VSGASTAPTIVADTTENATASTGLSLLAGVNHPWVRASLAAGVGGLLSILFSLSYAALIFSGHRLSPWLAYGTAATFISGAVGGAIIAARSSLPFAIGAPDGPTCAVIAALVTTLARHFTGPENVLPATLVALAMSAALSGLLLCALGLARAGRAIRFVPFPVIGGFHGASGPLMLLGALKILSGRQLSFDTLDELVITQHLENIVAGVAVAAFLLGGRRFWPSPLALPAQLVASIAIFDLVLLLAGIPVGEAQAEGWMFDVPSGVTIAPTWTLDFSQFPWASLPQLAADFIAVLFVGTISVLLNLTGIELSTRHDADLDHELRTVGAANLVCAALGGCTTCITSTRTNLNYRLSRGGRLAGLMISGFSAVLLFVNPNFLAFMPKAVLAGLLITIGADAMKRWFVDAARQLAWSEYLALVAIVAIIVGWGFVPGVLIGLVFGCASFAISAGRVNVVKFAFDGSEYRSSHDRGARELALLAAHGGELQGLTLQSYLFFGSASRLYDRVKALLAGTPGCRFLLFDFRLVAGMDSSATHSFGQIKRAADAAGAQVVLVHLPPALAGAFIGLRLLTDDILVFPELDHALEHCENEIISAHAPEGDEARSLHDWLREALRSAPLADTLARECTRLEFAAGEVIAAQGGPAASMHFVVEGRVGVMVDMGDGRSVRVRSLGRHTTIGEMGLITGFPRSATVKAETRSVAYELSAGTFERLKAEHPMLAQALLTYVIGVMSERLSFASRSIGVLRR
jgi:SulP family sulfate permease